MGKSTMLRFTLACGLLHTARSTVYSIADAGAIAGDASEATMWLNGGVMNSTLQSMADGDTLYVPEGVFYTMGGLMNTYALSDIVIQVDGTLSFAANRTTWPLQRNGEVCECILLTNVNNLLITSSTEGTLDGNGHAWWGGEQYIEFEEDRPKLLYVINVQGLVIENMYFRNSPFWTVNVYNADGVTIRYSRISAKWNESATTHLQGRELEAFNTDGFDIAGKNVHIHDCDIWVQDDCIAVKDVAGGSSNLRCAENWLVERVNASGVGLTIGSIQNSEEGTCVRNITFRDSTMYSTVKGIYMKSRVSEHSYTSSTIEDILYENITMVSPESWPIWIGPAQQANDGSGTQTCSLLWPYEYDAPCPVPVQTTWRNITLRNIFITNPATSPGVVIGNASNPMTGVVFDNVVVTNPGRDPWGESYYACYGVSGTTLGGTSPVPPCFNGGTSCLNATRMVALVTDGGNGDTCVDDDSAVAALTGGVITTCADAIATIGLTACTNSGNAYYDVATKYCPLSCGLCGSGARRRRQHVAQHHRAVRATADNTTGLACRSALSYTCSAGDSCVLPSAVVEGSIPVAQLLGLLFGILAVTGVVVAIAYAVRRRRSGAYDADIATPLMPLHSAGP
eukprot:m.1038095 g.1038095  ORF g.1038095 m.1038095 type:complete len:624 (-) comp24148_c0_seq2:3549-5420(-)